MLFLYTLQQKQDRQPSQLQRTSGNGSKVIKEQAAYSSSEKLFSSYQCFLSLYALNVVNILCYLLCSELFLRIAHEIQSNKDVVNYTCNLINMSVQNSLQSIKLAFLQLLHICKEAFSEVRICMHTQQHDKTTWHLK